MNPSRTHAPFFYSTKQRIPVFPPSSLEKSPSNAHALQVTQSYVLMLLFYLYNFDSYNLTQLNHTYFFTRIIAYKHFFMICFVFSKVKKS